MNYDLDIQPTTKDKKRLDVISKVDKKVVYGFT